MNADGDTIAATILSLERGALGRWGKGDVEGYLENLRRRCQLL